MSDLGPLPRQHPREQVVRQAEIKLGSYLEETTRELTTAESLRVVMSVLGNFVGMIAKYAIREERHPDDPEKPGGTA